MSAKIDSAYEFLDSLIVNGEEFPHACWKASIRFAVNSDELRLKYDKEQLDRGNIHATDVPSN